MYSSFNIHLMAVYWAFAYICYLWSMNKQAWMIQKTASNNINLQSLLSLLLCFKPSIKIRSIYNINTHTIVVLITCFVYYRYVKPVFTVNAIRQFNSSYNFNRYKHYFVLLLDLKFITLAGINKYTLTDLGLDIIKQISDNSYNIMYEFCQKYNIEL